MKTKRFKTKNLKVLNHPAINDCLIYDVETDSLNTDNGNVKFVGMYSYKHAKYFMFDMTEREAIQRMIDEHRVVIGFNTKGFDMPMMCNINNRFNMEYKIQFDCLSVLYDYPRRRSNREVVIKLKSGGTMQSRLPNRKLKTVAELLEFPITKGDIDYAIFQKSVWSADELRDIYLYLYKDVELTRLLFEYLVEYFDPLREYVPNKNVRNFDYIRSSLGSFAYAAICHLTGLPFEFETDPNKLKQVPENHGGFVLAPQVDYAEGTVIYADWASLYPHIFFMCNLFSPSDDYDGWDGDNFFELQDVYKNKEQGLIEKVLQDIYMRRRKYKDAGDPRQLALKILINTIYGLTGSPIFKSLFNMSTSGDCTSIARTMNKFVQSEFAKEGYNVIYGDTDSSFIHLPKDKTIDDFKKIAANITSTILKKVPFPADTFKLDVDDVFSKVWLFKKKHYMGINTKGKFVIKGLSIIKHDASNLGKLLLPRLKKETLANNDAKFSKAYLKKMVEDEIAKDITIVAQTYNVKKVNSYKSRTSIQAQISAELGEGTHLLVPNKKIGNIGKSKKYCTVEQAKTLHLEDIYLDKIWTELTPFLR